MAAPHLHVIQTSRATPDPARGEGAPALAPPHSAGAPVAFPEELVPLAADHVADLRMSSTFNGLLDLIDRAKDECEGADYRQPDVQIAGQAASALIDLQISLEATIQRLAEEAALAEADQLDRDFAMLPLAELKTEFRHLRRSQCMALIWAQARNVANACTTIKTKGA